MSQELGEALAALNHVKQARLEMAVELPAHAPGHDMVTPEHYRGSDAVFAQQDREASAVAGWLGMWTGALLLKDIIKDAVAEPVDERETHKQPKRHDCC